MSNTREAGWTQPLEHSSSAGILWPKCLNKAPPNPMTKSKRKKTYHGQSMRTRRTDSQTTYQNHNETDKRVVVDMGTGQTQSCFFTNKTRRGQARGPTLEESKEEEGVGRLENQAINDSPTSGHTCR
ncbi:unnamed protein product [Brassica rapa]|uniref:Uncharacterized protein n=2 Tax=Brassica TaxID=3705 RepID=A0A8D9CZH8_BRACM|nr:unnamed protein product [Brassica napus]CAG7864038.1 unnamed protein product [Brassica rapa]